MPIQVVVLLHVIIKPFIADFDSCTPWIYARIAACIISPYPGGNGTIAGC